MYFFTDVHGQWNLFKHMYKWCRKEDESALIIFGGDACDRGRFGYEIIKSLFSDPNIIYLKGNHEDLFYKAATSILRDHKEIPHFDSREAAAEFLDEIYISNVNHDVELHIYNGGEPTLISWLVDGAPTDILTYIDMLPYIYTNGIFDFTHAAPAPRVFERMATGGDAFDKYDCIWDRDHLNMGWFNGRINVSGHTPTLYLHPKVYPDGSDITKIHPCAWQGLMARNVYNGWRIDMDTAMTQTGRGFVLDCDNMSYTGFYDENVVNKMSQKGIVCIGTTKINIEGND